MAMEPYLSTWLLRDDRPRVIVLGNEKGGSGKSTVAIHLAMGLATAGLRVGTIDLDGRQGTFSRFVENRKRYAPTDQEAARMVFTEHRQISLSRDARKADSGDEKLAQLVTALETLGDCAFVVIDTPGSDNVLSRAAHMLADTLITPLNSSFLDLDALVRVNREGNQISGPSAYSELVLFMSEQRADMSASSIDWLIITNRLPNVPTRVHRTVIEILRKLSERLGFHFLPSIHERVIFRELFMKGLTVLDSAELDSAAAGTARPAREEVEALVDAVLVRSPWKELAARRADARSKPQQKAPKKSYISFDNMDPSRPRQ
jgi:chromosome partitioning protein